MGDSTSLAEALEAAELIGANGYVLGGHPEIGGRVAPLENLAL